ncbi:MAG: hypothetical protein AB2652_06050 [Candidatus Thiodiazotropha endolucinida]
MNSLPSRLVQLTIFANIALAAVYLYSYVVTPERILAVATVISLILFVNKVRPISRQTKKVLIVGFSLILFKYLVDSTIHIQNIFDPIKIALIEIFALVYLPIVEWNKISNKVVYNTILISAIPGIIFGVIQALGANITIKSIVPNNPIVIFEKERFDYFEHTGRIVGTFTTGVLFSLLLGTLFIILMARLWEGPNYLRNYIKKILFTTILLLLFFLILYTQTRSAIYGLPASVILGYYLSSRHFVKKTFIVLLAGAIGVFSFGTFQMLVTGVSQRSTLGIDANTYYKLTSNIYGVYAALARDPLFGVPVNRRLDRGEGSDDDMKLVEEGRRKLGKIITTGESYQLTATNHNQIAYYIKYYGLIGFSLFILLLYVVFKKIKQKEDSATRFILMCVFVYHIQFSLLHNNQLLETLLFWILLGLGDEYKYTNRKRANGDVQ